MRQRKHFGVLDLVNSVILSGSDGSFNLYVKIARFQLLKITP
jgi:hypothetical protein